MGQPRNARDAAKDLARDLADISRVSGTVPLHKRPEDARSGRAAREHDRLAAQGAQAWLLALRDRAEEVEEDTPEGYQKRLQLVQLLVSGITAGWDADDTMDVRITYRFGSPDVPDSGELFTIGVNDSP